MDKNLKDFRFTMPPIIGQPDLPTDPGEPPTRKGQCCLNCNAFAILSNQPICAARPPTPIFLGFQPGKTLGPQGQPQQFPVVVGFWPPTDEDKWCRDWEWRGPENEL